MHLEYPTVECPIRHRNRRLAPAEELAEWEARHAKWVRRVQHDIKRHCLVTPEQALARMRLYEAAVPRERTIFACASCGAKDLADQVEGRWVSLEALTDEPEHVRFKLSDAAVAARDKLGDVAMLRLCDATDAPARYERVDVNLRPLVSCVEHANQWLHLYPALVDAHASGPRAWMCAACRRALAG